MLNYGSDGGRDRVQYELRSDGCGLKLRVTVFALPAQNLLEPPC
jgi:hypothetical protein